MEDHKKKEEVHTHKSHEVHKHPTHHVHHKPKGMGKSFYNHLFIVLGVVIILFAAYNTYQISSFGGIFDGKLAEAEEAAKPAVIEFTVIDTDCEDCYDIGAVVELIESTEVEVKDKKRLDPSSAEAKELIGKYGIEKLPTVIITGEFEKSRSLASSLNDVGEVIDGDYVLTELVPPYVDAVTGAVLGKVSLIQLEKKDCDDCSDLSTFVKQLKSTGVIFKSEQVVDVDSASGKSLVSKYDIEKVPIVILDKEAEAYPNIKVGWDTIGTVEEDGSFVMREANPPYFDLDAGVLKGLLHLTILEDGSCKECYDGEEFHKPILLRLGVVLGDEKTVDISSAEGRLIVEKYDIEQVPAIILEGDVEEYVSLTDAWASVGTVEDDGAYVFREADIAGKPYTDLVKGEVVTPAVTG
ncbi:MAG: hypothetical protein QF824_04970 [Candidatus Woesearchaeota archaeon]|jgi:hypothetical protein|nr:hypothetical protein [Candidatus Woesearchaeota archaeon]